ncbi:MAG: response regulator [Chromatiales bacterium]|jgi:CheY-like chemotaxis protein
MSTKPLERILYVEDEPDIQTVARLALEMVGGYQVEICSSGREALEQVGPFAPDLILLDVMMPEMDGPSTLEAIRKREDTRETPVIFVTAKVQSQEIAQYKGMGALDVIAKPFDPMGLPKEIEEIWNRYCGRE